MRKRIVLLGLVVVILGVVSLLGLVRVRSSERVEPLLEMLALVPDAKELSPELYFFDLRAAEAAMEIPPVTAADYNKMDDKALRKWFNTLGRAKLSSILVEGLPSLIVDLPKTAGMDWENLERTLTVGDTPNDILLIGGKFDTTRISDALQKQGYTSSTVDGNTIWSKGDEGVINPNKPVLGSPFITRLGRSARVVLLPGYVTNSSYTDNAKLVIGVQKGTQPTWAAKAEIRALAEAITDPKVYKGSLVQAYMPPSKSFQPVSAPPKRVREDIGDLSSYDTLPSSKLVIFADRQEGTEQVSMVAVVYPDLATAERAASELHKRFSAFYPERVKEVQAKFDTPHVYQGGKGGPAVVVIAARYALLESPTEAEQRLSERPAYLLYYWISSIGRDELYPLTLKVGQ